MTALLAVATLWWTTASEDAEWALWRHYPASTAALNMVVSGLVLAGAYVLGSPRRMRRLTGILVATTVFVFSVAVLEVPAAFFGHDYRRAFGIQESDTWLQLAAGVNRSDPDLIHVHRPHSRFVGTVSGNLGRYGIPPTRYPIDVEYDQNGFRNSVDLTRADVVAIGDSFVEAAELPRAETVVAHLARALGVPVANLGQSNYGPQQEFIVLERYGLPLSPKTVLWFFFGGNDLRDSDLYARMRKRRASLADSPFLERSFVHNAVRALARLTTPVRRAAAPAARERAGEFTKADGATELMYFDDPEGAWTQQQWDVVTTTLQRARDLTQRSAADLVLVYIPRKFRVYRGYVRATSGSAIDRWTSNDLPDVLGRWCAERSIEFFDSTPVLRKAVASGESVYLQDDVHWNARGHEVVAAAIARYIQERQRPSAMSQ